MMTPLVKHLLGSTCALLLTATFSAPAEGAFFNWFGHGCGHGGYSTYYGGGYGHGASCGGCGSCNQCSGYRGYTTGYRGYGYGYYTPSYSLYAPSHYGSACGTSCSPCGSSCGTSCNPCGVSYGGFSCGSCGIASCSGGCGIASNNCGISTIGCASDCGTGIVPASGTTTPNGTTPPNEQYSPPANDKTYRDDDTTGSDRGPFVQPTRPNSNSRPQQPPRSNDNSGGGLFPETDDEGGLFPSNDGSPAIERREFKPIGEEPIRRKADHSPADEEPADAHQPADMEPTDEELPPADPPKDARIRPLDIETEVASSVTPDRRRTHYSVRFHAPRVARLDVKPSSKWTPIDPGTKLAATK